jgi:lysophospholipase L1-like esterase
VVGSPPVFRRKEGIMRPLFSRAARVGALLSSLFVLAVATAPAASGADNYVALGDSFSSGVGTGSYTLSSSCRRGVFAYPWLVSQQRAGTMLTFVACSGATTSSLMSNQIGSVTAGTTIVTVTIGGNDIGFADLIVQCTLGSCSTALDSTRATLETFLGPRLDAVYSAIRSRAMTAKVVVLGYPRLFSSASCFGTLGISSTERTKANELATALDDLSRRRAALAGVTYVSALAHFTGHAVCSSSAWVNGLNLFNTVESYHPNRNGNSLGYASQVLLALG